MTRTLLTGASGFVGSHALEHLLINTTDTVVCPVSFRHRGRAARLAHVLDSHPSEAHRVEVVMCDLTAPIDPQTSASFQGVDGVDAVWNIASESHVDRSITSPATFVRNNVDSVLNLLDWARDARPSLFLHMSTDEVYGPAYGAHRHVEWEPARPSNPYAASKAAQEDIAFSYWRTFDLPVVITNTMNIIGERQDPEKFVPMVIKRALHGEVIDIHASPSGVPGSRFYLHARNLSDAWAHLTARTPVRYSDGATQPDRWHIVGEREIDNATLARMIHTYVSEFLETPTPPLLLNFTSVHAARPGHDLRYALDGGKLAGDGWVAPVPLDESLRRTVAWYLSNPTWLMESAS